MNCDQFEERAQWLLDERACLTRDSLLREHSRECVECQQTLVYYNRFSDLSQQEFSDEPKVTPRSLGAHEAWRGRQRNWLRNRILTVTVASVASVAICVALMTRPMATEIETANLVAPSAPTQKIVNADSSTATSFYDSIDLTYLMPVWSVEIADQSNVDLTSISNLTLIDFVPVEPVRAVQSIPAKLAPIYRFSVELPVVNRWSDQISCTISLIQNSLMPPTRFPNEEPDDFCALLEMNFHDYC